MSEPRPSAVRKRILREHTEIRGLLDRLERAAKGLHTGKAGALAEARELRDTLCERLKAHVDLEDAVLAPALRDADAWGDVRADKLVTHHREQREELDAIEHEQGRSDSGYAQRLLALVEDIRKDMMHEEKDLLTDELLRDDVVSIYPEDG